MRQTPSISTFRSPQRNSENDYRMIRKDASRLSLYKKAQWQKEKASIYPDCEGCCSCAQNESQWRLTGAVTVFVRRVSYSPFPSQNNVIPLVRVDCIIMILFALSSPPIFLAFSVRIWNPLRHSLWFTEVIHLQRFSCLFCPVELLLLTGCSRRRFRTEYKWNKRQWRKWVQQFSQFTVA